MKVYTNDPEQPRLLGRADVPDDVGAVFTVRLFGAASVIAEDFCIGTVTHLPPGGLPVVERVVLVAQGQRPELLPGWSALDS